MNWKVSGAVCMVCILLAGIGLAVAEEKPEPAVAPDVVGKWTGTWGPYDPAPDAKQEKQPKLGLDCNVVRSDDGSWQATFEGECGRPYKYTIKMDGRQAGEVVLFKGTTDLGAEDGGVYDWIGRATNDEFIGFYTSAKYQGVFSLSRKKE